MRRDLVAIGFSAALAGCVVEPPRAAALAPPTTASWQAGLQRLEALRAATRGPRTMRLALALREPFAGHVFRARGGVALRAGGLRMILLGPAGATALDLWSRGDRFRFAIPALDRVVRGDASTPRASMRGVPVDFLRFWLLDPAGGRLLWHERRGAADRFVLREGGAIVDLVAHDDGRVVASRATFEGDRRVETERVEASGVGCAEVTYTQESTGLVVRVSCEGQTDGANERAFEDPDARAP